MDTFKLALVAPDQFQTVVMAWIGALVVVTAGLGVLIAKIKPLIEQLGELFRRTDAQNHRLESQQQQITNVALATPTNGLSSKPTDDPVSVRVDNEATDPVPTTSTTTAKPNV